MFRDGQWVKWQGNIPGAAVARDGKIVGIFCNGGTDPLGSHKAPKLVPVDHHGHDVVEMIGGIWVKIQLDVNQPGVEPVLSREDIPAERIKDNPNWQPKA